MARQRGRLDPEEVKRALAAEQKSAQPEAPFHSPFAAARAQLEKVVVSDSGKPAVGVRRRQRGQQRHEEPSELARARASHRAARQALADAVKPRRRSPRRPGDPGGDGAGGG